MPKRPIDPEDPCKGCIYKNSGYKYCKMCAEEGRYTDYTSQEEMDAMDDFDERCDYLR